MRIALLKPAPRTSLSPGASAPSETAQDPAPASPFSDAFALEVPQRLCPPRGDELNAAAVSPVSEADVSDNEPDWLECDKVALIQAKAEAWAYLLPTLPPGPVPRVPVRMVPTREFQALLEQEPLDSMVRALQSDDAGTAERAVRWVGRTLKAFFSPARVPLPLPPLGRDLAAYLPSRHEVVLCDDLVPNSHAWAAALRAPLAMACLHHRAPQYLGALLGQWATHVRYEAARARPEVSPELLLSQASRENARGRWAWWSAFAALTAASHELQGDPAGWCRQVAEALRAPLRLVRKLVQLHQQDPEMLLATLQDPLRIDALARCAFETLVFVPYGQTEVTLQRLHAVDRCSPANAVLVERRDLAVVEFAPLRGMPLDVRQAPVSAACQLLENGFCPQAVRVLEETIHLNPDNIAALLALAELYLQQARPQHAQACYERVLSLRPAHGRAALGIKRIEAERGLATPEASLRRDLQALIPSPRLVLPQV